MTAGLWEAAGIVAFLIVAVWLLNRAFTAMQEAAEDSELDARDRSAEAAARAVADDVAEARRRREVAALEAAFKIRSPRRNTIPSQRQPRRTEEDQ